MNVVAYGGGVDSTAMLIECFNRKVDIDLILFADTGGEKPHTYKYKKIFSKWLVQHGLPEIITVQQVNINGTAVTLEQICLNEHKLPSLAYGFKSCSLKHKVAPQDKYVNNWQPAKDEWNAGRKVTKLIGYDAGEDRRAKIFEDDKYSFFYPLIEWNIDRKQCIEIIKKGGLPVPDKSACYFCPSSKPSEVKNLKRQYPELAKRAIEMENNAELTSVKGLGRGWAWGNLLATDDLFDDDEFTVEIACDCYDG